MAPQLTCLRSPVTCLALSHGESQLLVGTRSGEIHIHSLPSHQQLRTITAHSGPITHLSTLVRPADLSSSATRNDPWPIMEIRNLERTRTNASSKHAQTVGISLRPSMARADWTGCDALHPRSSLLARSMRQATGRITRQHCLRKSRAASCARPRSQAQ
jgi:pre-rRNA-processing protein IPI3